MSFTAHGHHIPFTFLGDEKPVLVEGCGGVRMCTSCTLEAMRYLPAFGAKQGRPLDDLKFLLMAHAAVIKQLREHLQEAEGAIDRDQYLRFHNVTVSS